jgi:predicted nucleic acid-binding protein
VNIVFADTGFYVAQIDPKDDHHASALEAFELARPVRVVTSEMILIELLNFFARRGEPLRTAAADLVDRIRELRNVEVVPSSPELFDLALLMYRERPDKDWSLTDCASFVIMRNKGISSALAIDRHFEQAGFRLLIRPE